MLRHDSCKVFPVLFLCTVAAFAQNAPSAVKQQDANEDAAAHAVHLNVVVEGKDGVPVAGLTQQDFTVLDSKIPQKITTFQPMNGATAPVEVIVLIDSVNIGYTTIAYERQEIGKFFQSNGGKLPYPTSLAIFSDTGTQIMNGFSQNGTDLSAALDHFTIGLRALTRSSGFYGAGDRVEMSLRTLDQLAASVARLPGRKLVLWMSPGWPILSGPGVELSNRQQQNIFDEIVKVSTELRLAGITLYSIDPLGSADAGFRTMYYKNFLKPVRKPSQVTFGNLSLQVLATQSGGLVLNSSNDTASLMQRAVKDASAYYEVTFNAVPGEPDEYHQVEVRIAKPGFSVRTQAGYYSQR